MGDPACCPALDSLDLIYVFVSTRVPYRGGILYLRPNKSLICCLTYAFMFGAYISTYIVLDSQRRTKPKHFIDIIYSYTTLRTWVLPAVGGKYTDLQKKERKKDCAHPLIAQPQAHVRYHLSTWIAASVAV